MYKKKIHSDLYYTKNIFCFLPPIIIQAAMCTSEGCIYKDSTTYS